jgi:hypothetical protein
VAQETTTLEDVEDIVLRKVRDKEHRPVALLESLSEAGYSSAQLKLAVAQLLHEGQIELTPERLLRAGSGS